MSDSGHPRIGESAAFVQGSGMSYPPGWTWSVPAITEQSRGVMPETIHCPQCNRVLRVPDDLLGQQVKCPVCSTTFTAEMGGPPPRNTDEAAPSEPGGTYGFEPEDRVEDQPRSASPEPRRRESYEWTPPDEDYGGGMPSRRRRGSRGEAKAEVEGPATAIMVITILSLVFLTCVTCGNILGMAGAGLDAGDFDGRRGGLRQNPMLNMVEGAGGLVQCVIALVVEIIILVGAQKMKNLESHGWAMASAILCVIPCTSPCCLLGIPFGIWALVVLGKPEVKDAFDR